MENWTPEQRERYRRMAARHEAAHAVAAVRLGLELDRVSIAELRPVRNGTGDVVNVEGDTRLVDGMQETWQGELPDEAATEGLKAIAVMAMAGGFGPDASFHPSPRDMLRCAEVAGAIAAKSNGSDPTYIPVRDDAERARRLLAMGGGRAWKEVADALLARETLTGDDVRRILAGE